MSSGARLSDAQAVAVGEDDGFSHSRFEGTLSPVGGGATGGRGTSSPCVCYCIQQYATIRVGTWLVHIVQTPTTLQVAE